jgi:hypothetical protein
MVNGFGQGALHGTQAGPTTRISCETHMPVGMRRYAQSLEIGETVSLLMRGPLIL